MNNFDLDRSLIELVSREGSSRWTIRSAVEGKQIFGGIGSGKTSGSGRMIAIKYLQAGFGGLVLTVKPDEKEMWQQLCRISGRSNDLVIIEPGGEHYFNFLDYESGPKIRGAALTENIVQVLKTVIRAGEEQSAGKSDDPFWEKALDMLIFNVIDLCQLAYEKLSVQRMYDIATAIPKINEDGTMRYTGEESNAYYQAITAAKDNIVSKMDHWYSSKSFEERSVIEAGQSFEAAFFEKVPQARLYKFVEQFFSDNFIPLSEKTRSIIDFTFSGFLFRLLRDPVYTLFCDKKSTVTPEDRIV